MADEAEAARAMGIAAVVVRTMGIPEETLEVAGTAAVAVVAEKKADRVKATGTPGQILEAMGIAIAAVAAGELGAAEEMLEMAEPMGAPQVASVTVPGATAAATKAM
jgi:hypothetical protein